MSLTEWIPTATGVGTLVANLVVTFLNIRNSRYLEREKKHWEVHAKNLERLVELKETLHTCETPEHFDIAEVEWALKQGAPRQEVFDSVTRYLAAQAEGYHLAKAEYRSNSHLFAPSAREALTNLISRADTLAKEIGPQANRDDKPLDSSGLEAVDRIVDARHDFIKALYEQIDSAIDKHRKALK
jgi:hypothetical protein